MNPASIDENNVDRYCSNSFELYLQTRRLQTNAPLTFELICPLTEIIFEHAKRLAYCLQNNENIYVELRWWLVNLVSLVIQDL